MKNKGVLTPDSRRSFIKQAGLTTAAAGALFGGFGIDPFIASAMAQEMGRSEQPLRAAFSNAGLQATWCAQGKQAAEYWGKLFNVDVTWFDGELSAPKQRAAIDNMATQDWDFVAIQAFGIGTLTDPGQQDDRRRHPGDRHGHADRPSRGDQRPQLPRPGQRVHGCRGDPGAGRRDGRRGHDHHDPGRPGSHRCTGPRPRLLFGGREVPEHRGPRRAAGRLGRDQGVADLGQPADQAPEHLQLRSSTTTTWRSPPTTSCRRAAGPTS